MVITLCLIKSSTVNSNYSLVSVSIDTIFLGELLNRFWAIRSSNIVTVVIELM